MSKHLCVLAAAVLLFNGAATAHSWYPRECCHNDDCHPVPCSELTATRYGLSWKGVAVFSEPMIRLSPDVDLLMQPSITASLVWFRFPSAAANK